MNKSHLTANKLPAVITPYSKIISHCYLHKDVINPFSPLRKKHPFLTNCSCICYTKIRGTQDAARVANRVKLAKYNSTCWNDWMSCLLLLLNWNDTDWEVMHNFSHRELKMHSSVLLEPLLLFNGICRTSMGWNRLGNLNTIIYYARAHDYVFHSAVFRLLCVSYVPWQ